MSKTDNMIRTDHTMTEFFVSPWTRPALVQYLHVHTEAQGYGLDTNLPHLHVLAEIKFVFSPSVFSVCNLKPPVSIKKHRSRHFFFWIAWLDAIEGAEMRLKVLQDTIK